MLLNIYLLIWYKLAAAKVIQILITSTILWSDQMNSSIKNVVHKNLAYFELLVCYSDQVN